MRSVLLAGLIVAAPAGALAACSDDAPPRSGADASTARPPAASSPSSPSGPAPTGSATAGRAPLGAPGCRPASPIRPYPGDGEDSGEGIPEVQGTGQGAELWGLLFAKPRAGREVKIAWRMTGSGDLRVSLTDPDGRTHPLAWGPEPHSSSTYGRPGDEWGTGMRFSKAGCWWLRAQRDSAGADVWFDVPAH